MIEAKDFISYLFSSILSEMLHVSAGRIRLKPGKSGLWFLWYGTPAYLQAKRAKGIVRSSVYRENSRTFWSLSVWTSAEAMLRYRNSGAHLRVMKVSQEMEAEVDFLHWQSDTVPTWDLARRRLIEHFDR